MNPQVIDLNEAVDCVATVEWPEGLAAFREPRCPAAIWRRRPISEFQTWIDGLSPDCLPRGRVVMHPAKARNVAFHLCETAGTPDCAERQMLIDDAAALAEIFANLMRTEALRLRFDVVSTNACRKFHVDAVTARLVCTYRGTGTQYGLSTDGGDPGHVFTVPTGAPILLRGTLWPTDPVSSFLHRSPPIEGSGETRLVLVLDPLSELGDER